MKQDNVPSPACGGGLGWGRGDSFAPIPTSPASGGRGASSGERNNGSSVGFSRCRRPKGGVTLADDVYVGDICVPTIRTTIDIGASAETVWRVLTHFPSYPKWNPFLREVHGNAEPGARLKARMRLSSKRSKRFSARVAKVIPAAELHWRRKFF